MRTLRAFIDVARSALGPGLDGAVRRLGREYDPLGRVLRVTSYSAASGGSVVNQVEWAYNGLGQPTAESQAHGGSVNQATTPRVQTAYADGGQNTARPTALTYPSGRVLSFSYGAAGSDGDRLSRVVGLVDAGPAPRVEYSYLGLGTIVRAVLPEPVIRWTLQNNASPTNPYPGLDRFGRVVDNAWMTGTTGGTAVDQIGYSYDRMGNRTRRLLSLGSENSEVYRYDGLNRLTDMARGLINAHSVPAASFAQSWSLDATGNWARFQQTEPAGGASQNFLQSRESNRANEIVDIAATYGPSWFVPVYDRAGNMIGLPRPESPANHRAAGYDAWNRLVTVNLGTWTYAYDALHRRITSTAGSNQRHYYYSASWQVLEERLGTNPDTAPAERQFVWGLRYLDDLVLRDRSPTNNGVLSERLYALQDANWNVTSLISPAGAVQERYRYAAYGQPTFLSAAFAPLAPNVSAFDWETLYGGYRYDRSTGLYQVRHRYLHPGLGCWLTRDPIEYESLLLNLLAYAYCGPLTYVDPFGLQPPAGLAAGPTLRTGPLKTGPVWGSGFSNPYGDSGQRGGGGSMPYPHYQPASNPVIYGPPGTNDFFRDWQWLRGQTRPTTGPTQPSIQAPGWDPAFQWTPSIGPRSHPLPKVAPWPGVSPGPESPSGQPGQDPQNQPQQEPVRPAGPPRPNWEHYLGCNAPELRRYPKCESYPHRNANAARIKCFGKNSRFRSPGPSKGLICNLEFRGWHGNVYCAGKFLGTVSCCDCCYVDFEGIPRVKNGCKCGFGE